MNQKREESDSKATPCLKQTSFHKAVIESAIETIEMMFDERKIDVDEKDGNGCTALHLALIHNSNLSTVKLLLDAGADIAERNNNYETAMHLAFKSRNDEIINFFLKEYYESFLELIFDEDLACQTPIDILFENADADTISYAVDLYKYQGIDDDFFPLLEAVEHENEKLVRHLLEGGMDPNEYNDLGNNAIFLATATNNVPIINLLLGKGARIRGTEFDQIAHLKWMFYKGNEQVFRALLAIKPNCELNIQKIIKSKGEIEGIWLCLKLANIFLDETLLHFPYFEDFEKLCLTIVNADTQQKIKQEIDAMKNYKIVNGLTVWNLLTKPSWKLAYYFKNDGQRKAALKVFEVFPIYSYILKPKFAIVTERVELFSSGATTLFKLFHQYEIDLPQEICEYILDYLTNEDLKKIKENCI